MDQNLPAELINPEQKNVTKITAENWDAIKEKYDLAPEIRESVVDKYYLFEKNEFHPETTPVWALVPNHLMEK